MDFISAYRKVIAAVVGLALLMLNKYVGIDLLGMETTLVDAIITALTAIGVWAVPNAEKPPVA